MAFSRAGGPASMVQSRSTPSIGSKKEMTSKMEDSLGFKMRNPTNRQPEPEPEAKSARTKKEAIPEDFFVDLVKAVEAHIDKAHPSERLWTSQPRSELRGVESLVSTPPTTPARTRRKNLDNTVSTSPRMMTSRSSPELDATIRIPSQSARFDGSGAVGSTQRSKAKTDTMSTSTGEQSTLRFPDESNRGWGQWEEDFQESNPLMRSGRTTLIEDLRLNAEASRADAAENTAGVEEDETEVPFWQRALETAEDDARYEVEQAIWRLRMGLRQRFGTAEKAWKAIERNVVSATGAFQPELPRPENMLSFAEIKIGLSRIGLKLPHVTGFDKIQTLLNALDKNGTRNLTFLELMGDDSDPSVYAAPPPPKKPAWQSDIMQPRWHMNWHQGFFDKDLEEHIILRDYHRPTKDRFRPPKQKDPEGYRPIWEKYKEVQDEHNQNREKASRLKKEQETEGCTFKPDIDDSLRTAKIILAQKQKRARSQPTSVHTKNYEKLMERRREEEREYTFHPEVCKRTNEIWENIIDTGDAWWVRLAEKDKHDRMNHVAFMEAQEQEIMPFKPNISETSGYKMRTDLKRNVHERLYHHEKHEYWHGDERGLPSDAVQSGVTFRSQANSRSVSPAPASRATPSTTPRLALVEQAGDKPGEVTVEYRQPLLGLMEACERWGTDPNEDTWAKPVASRSPPLAKSAPSRKRGPFDNPQEESGISRTANEGARAAPESSGSGNASAKAKAKARSGTPPRSQQAASRSKTPPR